ncbi:MAG: GNAT family N-acetyltransferase [Pseudomonadota bacterium]
MTGATGTAYSLRPARTGDFPQLRTIEQAAAGLFPAGRVNIDETLTAAALTAHLNNRWLYCVSVATAATHDGGADAPVGFVAATPDGEALHINEMSVHPDHGQQGLGTRLLTFCVRRARRRGFTALTLTTFADLAWNAPFYRRLGFGDCAEDRLTSSLQKHLDAERQAGLTQRIAMQLPL